MVWYTLSLGKTQGICKKNIYIRCAFLWLYNYIYIYIYYIYIINILFPNSGVFSPEWLRCGLVQAPGQVQRGSGEGSEGSGEGVGGFGAERSGSTGLRSSGEGLRALVQNEVRFNRVPRRFRRRSGRLWCRAKSGSTGFRWRFRWRFRRLWCRARSGSTGSGEGCGKEGFGNLWCRAGSGSTGSAEGFQRLASQQASERFVKIKRRGCWGYHRSL